MGLYGVERRERRFKRGLGASLPYPMGKAFLWVFEGVICWTVNTKFFL